MGFRFRKSVNFGPFRLNLSKTGVGWSVGGPGVRWTQRADGKQQTTLNVPGTGISYVKTSSGRMPEEGPGRDQQFQGPSESDVQHTKEMVVVWGAATILIGLGISLFWTEYFLVSFIFLGVSAAIIFLTTRTRKPWRSTNRLLEESTTTIAEKDKPLHENKRELPGDLWFRTLAMGICTNYEEGMEAVRRGASSSESQLLFESDPKLLLLAALAGPSPSERNRYLSKFITSWKTITPSEQELWAPFDEKMKMTIRAPIEIGSHNVPGSDNWFAFIMPIKMTLDCAMTLQALNAFQIGDYRLVTSIVDSPLASRIDWHWNLFGALAYKELGDHQSAIRLLQGMLSQSHDEYSQATIRIYLSGLFGQIHDFQTSATLLRQGLARRGLPAEVRLAFTYMLGSQCLQLGKHIEAIKALSEVAARQYDYLDVQALLLEANRATRANKDRRADGTDDPRASSNNRSSGSASQPYQDSWEILGIGRSATQEEIKQTSKKLS